MNGQINRRKDIYIVNISMTQKSSVSINMKKQAEAEVVPSSSWVKSKFLKFS